MNKETEIITDLRTIKLVYENKKDLSEYEINLIEKYKNLHNEYALFSKEINEFEKSIINVDLQLDKMIKDVAIVKELYNEVQSFDNKKIAENDKRAMEIIENKVEKYNKKNTDTIKLVTEVDDLLDEIEKEYQRLNSKDEELVKQFEEFDDYSFELSENYKKYDIDLVQFDDDQQEFYEIVDSINSKWLKIDNYYSDLIIEKFNPVVDEYNKFLKLVGENKTISPITIKIPHESDSFPYLKNNKQYIIKPGHSKIAEYADNLTEAAKAGKGILLQIDFKAIERKDVSKIFEIIAVSQHKKSWIENIIFKMHIHLINIPETEPESIHSNMFSNKKVIAYLAELGKNPLAFFFMNQIDISMMSISADKLLSSELDVKKEENLYGEKDNEEEGMLIGYDNDQLQRLFNRFYNSCIEFHTYCDETGVDTRPYIEQAITGVRNRFGFDEKKINTFKYEDVVDYYEKMKSLPFPLNDN